MGRTTGTFPFSANFEVKLKGFLDARMFAPTYNDLLLFTPSNYLMNGFIVAVWDEDSTKRGLYQLIDDQNLNLTTSWKNISSNEDIPANLQELIDDFEARISSLEDDVTQAQADIIEALAKANQALTDILNTQSDLDNTKDRVTANEDSLSLKADKVDGKVPVTQLPLLGATKLYNDIAERDADTELTGVVLGLVLDPSNDTDNPGLTSPALYANTVSGWVLYNSDAGTEIVLDWANILNKPTSTATEIDQAVEDSLSKNPITYDITVGAWLAGETLPAFSNWETAIRKLGEKIFNPTYQNPTFSLFNNAGSLREIGETLDLTLTFNFNRGNILGKIVGGVWNAGTSQNPRAGIATNYNFISEEAQGSNLTSLTLGDYIVKQGSNYFTGEISYAQGAQPLNSKGGNYDAPYPSGTSPIQTTAFEGVYPIFASTTVITTSTKQSLISMLTGNNIQISLVAESGGNKQFVEIPETWLATRPLTSINYFNTVSNQFDTTNKLSDFTTTSVVKVVQGQNVNYKKYTYNGSDRAGILIKLNF